MNIKSPKKLIEVVLPLDIITVACSQEKSIRHGHPSTLRLWWARRPLAAARAYSLLHEQNKNRTSFSLKYMAIFISRPPPARGGGVNVQTPDPLAERD
jgi:adenine-specific DNA methylase